MAPERFPDGAMLTTEPGGQVEISSAPAAGPGDCIAGASLDLAALRQAIHQEGLCLSGRGLDPFRPPRRVLELPRYAAMEKFFNRRPWRLADDVQHRLGPGLRGRRR